MRETLRLIAVCLTSPDARVWPLKLTRVLGSNGDAAAAFFGAQLVSTGRTMGPGTVSGAAALLSRIADLEDAESFAAALADVRRQSGGRLAGFGVPFRAQDERLVGLRRLIEARPRHKNGRHWRALERATALVPVAPNVAGGVAALLLDCGVRPALCGLGLSLLMAHVFLGHAVEAGDTDGALRALPTSVVHYRGPARRVLATPDDTRV